MDAIKAVFLWPIVIAFQYIRFTIGLVICAPLLLLTTRGNAKFFTLYKNLSSLPLGKYVFSGIVCFYAPYTCSISGVVQELTETSCKITMRDWPWLRNPFSSIHAIALTNFGEFSSGLLMVALLQSHRSLRGIPIKITTEYYKKARGVIRAVSTATKLESVTAQCDVECSALIYDASGDLVAKTIVTWTLSVKEASSSKKGALAPAQDGQTNSHHAVKQE